MIDLSIVIPAYNEAERIGKTLQLFNTYLSNTAWTYELIVVDDGSTDDTIMVVEKLKPQIQNLSILPSAENHGKGYVVRVGMLKAQGKFRLFSDADGSTPIEEIDKLLAPLLNKTADVSIGSRYLDHSNISTPQPFLRRLWSRLANKVVQYILLPGIVDPHCGFKVFTADATTKIFSQCQINEWSFDLEVLAIARKLNLTINESPVMWANDEQSKGKLSQLPREVMNLYRIKKRIHKQIKSA
jgi:dolichyl-phosphate beta-glucosyltransferase